MMSVYLFIVYYVVSILFLVGKCDFAFPCITWDDGTGVCVNVDSCAGFRQALNKSYSFVNDLWTNSPCYQNDPNTVCCGYFEGKLYFTFDVQVSVTVPSTTTTVSHETPSASYKEVWDQYNDIIQLRLLLSSGRCGKDQAGNRLIDRTSTATADVDEFTWLVHIISKESTNSSCTGILINPFYVLTSYSCGFNAEKVRLGVYRLNETTTCIVTSPNDNYLDCMKTVEERNVEFISDANNIPEVGILRLEPKVQFSDFVRPICLPFEENVAPKLNQKVFVSGWNLLDGEGTKYSKQKLLYRLARNDECYHSAFSSHLNEEKAFCLVAEHNSPVAADFAEGTEPIIYQYNNGSWYLAGFRWLTIPSNQDSNEIGGKRILGSTVNLSTLKWILDKIQLLKKR
ncbi:hypothetical protein ILUMI_06847 [Ignelater luminosus]|uniref:Peptidase S1 domain-containing protein n=1 Tax=Ignelater luminosus TaxID=2038154 RepID=A0A8K0GGU6_IGNLU|nr:hypothetical protein ILUMI_06847 [Ignelater luminosus]